jgi:hypothetical protein
MAPDGLGKLFLAFRIFMGLTFNLVLLGLPVFAAGILLAEILYGPGYGDLLAGCAKGEHGCDGLADVPAGGWIAVAAMAAAVLAIGLWCLQWRFQHDATRRAVETWAVRLLLGLGALALVLVGMPVLVDLLFATHGPAPDVGEAASGSAVPAATASGLGALLVGALSVARERFTAAASLESAGARFKSLRGLPRQARLAVAYVVGAVVGPAVFVLIAVYGVAIALAAGDGRITLVAVGALALFALIDASADLNTWSLHPFYRRRLCTAFALKRVKGPDDRPVAQERDFARLVPLSASGVKPGPGGTSWPTLLVCAAANVSDPGATPPGRGVTSFTFSPMAIGGPLIGGVSTTEFERSLGSNRVRDITLPAAVAMSGAALAPSMGKLTRKPFTFLMALANLRLGVWVPNPRHLDEWRQRQRLGPIQRGLQALRAGLPWRRRAPVKARDVRRVPRPSYLLRELLGRNQVDARFLYVSDGGHYENLGLVELLRRGCMQISCFDASGGKTAKELGDAIALARSELGVEIEFDDDLRAVLEETGSPPVAERCCAVGRIRYPGVEQEGRLVYVRTVMVKGLPWDVCAFRETDPAFPHHSTIDQLFTDQKFEAYRALGFHAGLAAYAAMNEGDEPEAEPSGLDAPEVEPVTIVPAPVPEVAALPPMATNGGSWVREGGVPVLQVWRPRIEVHLRSPRRRTVDRR